jgi:carbamoyltransferase
MSNYFTLGINFLHSDSSACIFKDNILIAASEEERFTRVKHTSTFPINSIKYCLKEANIDISKINLVTINTNPFSGLSKKILFVLKNLSSIKIALSSLINSKDKINLPRLLSNIDEKNKFLGKIKFVDHHKSHIASSLFSSTFSECANLSIDGFGDFASCAYGLYKDKKLKIDNKISFPHSLGIFYQSLTQFLGFKSYGDEYKLMGLSSYGQPKYVNEISKIVSKTDNGFELNLRYFVHHKKKIFKINNLGQFIYENLYSENLIDLLGPEREINEKISQRHLDLAKSTQVVYEEILFYLINKVHEKYNMDNLTISGGCAMNSLANGKIIEKTKFKNIYVSPNPGDAGGAIGSASIILNEKFKDNIKIYNYSYLGSKYKNDEISKIIKEKKLNKKFEVYFLDYKDLNSFVVNQLIKEKVIGWFQGRSEWGPRALGNRSILADPRNKDIKEIINTKIKRRENFRPFAPSILKDNVSDWFEEDINVPFMSEVKMIRKDKRDLIPGVTHIDGTGRLQTVTKKQNENYYNLIKEFYNVTGVPIILNTSFNENEPIVNNPSEAINCYERTNMDILVLGNWVIQRQ